MRSMALLVIDDDEDFAQSLALLLEDGGHRVEVAHTIDDGLARYLERDYDLVLIDVRLRGESGVECFEQLREINQDVQAVMMTGYSVEEVLNRAIRSGARRVLRKPFSEEELIQVLASVA